MNQIPGLEELLAAGRLSEMHALADRFLRPRLRRLLAARWLPESLLDDAMQETFVRVLRFHGSYSPARASARTWLWTLGRSVVADLARRHRTRKMGSLFGRDGELLHDAADGGLPASPDEAEALAEAAMARMPAHHREAVRLRLEGLPQKEAAERLGLKAGNIGVIYHKFRRHVQEALGA